MKPILFSTPMVQAVLAGRKTQTRRLIKPQPHECAVAAVDLTVCARYQPGDILWVRETFGYRCDDCEHNQGEDHRDATCIFGDCDRFVYLANDDFCHDRWRPSIHMPREAARIFLRVTGVRVERVQEISADDALFEGMPGKYICGGSLCPEVDEFHALWNTLYAERGYSWESNPWVFVYEFEVMNNETRP